MKKILLILLVIVFMPVSKSATAQEELKYFVKVSPEVKSAVNKMLNSKLEKFYEEFKYAPYLQYAFIDLNMDGKNEIVVRFVEEYDFRDRYDNVDHHIFAQTSKGLIEILYVQAWELKIDYPRKNTLRNILAYNKPRDKETIYVWNGSNKYVEKK
jgi:hypothetical protein